MLVRNNYFLRIYELNKKFRYVTVNKSHQRKEIIRRCSISLVQKILGFYIARIEKYSEIRRDFLLIDIIYAPVVSNQLSIDYYFSDGLDLLEGKYIIILQPGNVIIVRTIMVEKIVLIGVLNIVLVNLE